MDGHQFDALTRFVATPRTRRQLVRAVGASLVAGLAGIGRAGAASCADRCNRLPDATDRAQCLAACAAADQAGAGGDAARATATTLRDCLGTGGQLCGTGSNVVCCAAGETCQAGQCRGPETNPGPCQPVGAACTVDSDCCSSVCSHGVCAACPPGSRECDGVCYPGGCCSDADCGAPCLVCGTDHVCHDCPAGQVCDGTTCCTPETCQPGQCGPIDNGCGRALDCGDCPSGQICRNGTCAPVCTPNCNDKACGPDGCGGSCGTCDVSLCLTCDDASHTCVSTCVGGQVCHQGICCTPKTCQTAGVTCGTIPDGCGGTLHCGDCPNGQTCHQGSCCTPNCAGRHCGDDGCGGSCGTCGAGYDCVNGGCFKITSDITCPDCPDTCDSCGGSIFGSDHYLCVVVGQQTGCTSNAGCPVGQGCVKGEFGLCVAPC